MDAPVAAPDALIRPWRRATIVASLIAAVELVALVGAGFVVLAKPLAHEVRKQAEARAFQPAPKPAPPAKKAKKAAAPTLTRSQTGVLVLNGNGRTGAAAAGAARLHRFGYVIAGTGNAPRHDYATSVVMYRAGFGPEARRLASRPEAEGRRTARRPPQVRADGRPPGADPRRRLRAGAHASGSGLTGARPVLSSAACRS